MHTTHNSFNQSAAIIITTVCIAAIAITLLIIYKNQHQKVDDFNLDVPVYHNQPVNTQSTPSTNVTP